MKIEVNGTGINYVMSGRKQGAVVTMSHSLGSGLDMWKPQLPALESRYRALRYDTRGHGGSDATDGPYSLEQLAMDAVGLLDALDIASCHWVGLSMGGMIGQCIALNHPHRLLSLSLCDTAALMPEENQPVWDERIATVRDKGPEALVQGTMERWFTRAYLDRGSSQAARIKQQFLSTPVAGFVGCSEAIRRIDYLDRLKEIAMPTLIMVGEEDPGTPVAASRAMHERIPGSRLVVIPSAAHLSNVEQAEIFNEHLLRFLDERR